MSKNPPVGEWLSNLSPDLQEITKALRAVARRNMPGVINVRFCQLIVALRTEVY